MMSRDMRQFQGPSCWSVSTHETFRKQMTSSNLQYIRVYPSRNLKQEWLGRQEKRVGNKDGL